MYKGVIFDFDGVIIDSEPVYLERRRKILEKLGIKVSEEELKKLSGLSGSEVRKKYREWIPGQEEKMSSYSVEEVKRMFAEPKTYIFPGMEGLILQLRKRPIRLAVASSNHIKNIEMVLKAIHLDNCFDVLMGREDVSRSKPDPEIYRKTAEKLGLLPKECIVIEDSCYGIQAAKSAGAYVIARKETRYGYSQEGADVIAGTTEELAAAIAEKLCEI